MRKKAPITESSYSLSNKRKTISSIIFLYIINGILKKNKTRCVPLAAAAIFYQAEETA